MTDIEKRAWEKYPEVIKRHNLAHIDINEKKRQMYIEAATEQKARDINKACEIYEKEIRQMKRILNEVKDGAGELISVGGSLIQFRKAMEEQQ